jgi:HlyD family secretion protein
MTTPPIYRASAVERLSDPDQLDRLLKVTTRPLWAGLAGVWLVVAAVALWSVAGRVPFTVAGSGLLLSAAGLRELSTQGAGVVEALPLQVGDSVAPGMVVARIRQPLLAQEVAQAEQRIRALENEHETRRSFVQRGLAVETSRLDAARLDLERRQRTLAERIRFLEGRVAAERQARAQGLITESVVQATVLALETARAEAASLALELRQNDLRRIQNADDSTERLTEVERRLQDAQRELAALRLSLEQNSRVVSTHRGTIREIRSSVGQLVTAGQSLLSVELVNAPVHGVVFVARDAKRIAPGMRVRVAPAAVPQEEFGYIVGTVRSVSTQPATLAGMARTLGNDLLVQQLAVQGASFLVEVDLQRDPRTPSGFRWSSKTGPPAAVSTGSAVAATIEIERRRPIELLVPFLRRLAGLPA